MYQLLLFTTLKKIGPGRGSSIKWMTDNIFSVGKYGVNLVCCLNLVKCWVVDLVEKKNPQKHFFEIVFFSTLIISISVDMFVCPSVRSSAPLIQWRFRWNFVGRFIPWPIVCKWEPLLWTPPLPSNGTLKSLKNHKKFIFSKNKNRATSDCGQYIQPYCQKFPAGSYENCRRR